MKKNIVLIRFSSRESGNSSAIINYLTTYYRSESIRNFTVDSTMIRPCDNCGYECLHLDKTCPNLTQFYKTMMDCICSADLVYFVIPNYCGYPCSNYFAFNERSVGYFNLDRALMQKYMNVNKRFIIISNSIGEPFISAMKQQVDGEPDILYLRSDQYAKKSIDGDILDSDAARNDLNDFLNQYSF